MAAIAAPATAQAKPSYRIKIISSPSGATVYIDSRENEAVGKTPLTHKLPAGNHTLILELADHEQLVDSIYVDKRRGRTQTYKLKLKEIQYGYVSVTAKNNGAHGADILVDGKKSGIVPRTITMSPGAHQVEIVKKGYKRFEKWLEVKANKKLRLKVALESADGSDPEDEPDPDPDPVVKNKTTPKPTPPGTEVLLTATAGVEVGWRKLRYRNAQTDNLRPYDAGAVGMLHLQAHIRPLARSNNLSMRRAAITAKLAFAAPMKTNTVGGAEAIETSWRELDVGVRYAIPLSGEVSLAVDVAYGATQFAFTNAGILMDSLPEVDYRYFRLAGELVYRSGKLRTTIGGAWLPVQSTGMLADRFDSVASAGFRVHIRAAHAVTENLAADISGFYRRYDHNFVYEPGDAFRADGAEDHFFGITLGLTLRAF